jgi:NAD(P)H dehydrogenase (quinone)
MRVLVLHAHPVAESYNGFLHRLIVERLKAKGHEVDDCDLYAEGFDPRLTATSGSTITRSGRISSR